MEEQVLSVREISQDDVPLITRYWLEAAPAYLEGMGVDLNKMPGEESWTNMLMEQLSLPYLQKRSYCIIWELNGKPIGHCNVNNIIAGESASMHLHIWYAAERKLGLGSSFIQLSLPYFFHHLQLRTIRCEPFALNPSPNKALAKAGFTFIKAHTCIPGSLNYEQLVNLWEINREDINLELLK